MAHLLESGRKLKFNSTFYEESIEKTTTIMILPKVANSCCCPELKFKNAKAVERDSDEDENGDFCEFEEPKPNFKKKKRPMYLFQSTNIGHDNSRSKPKSTGMEKLATSLRMRKSELDKKPEKER